MQFPVLRRLSIYVLHVAEHFANLIFRVFTGLNQEPRRCTWLVRLPVMGSVVPRRSKRLKRSPSTENEGVCQVCNNLDPSYLTSASIITQYDGLKWYKLDISFKRLQASADNGDGCPACSMISSGIKPYSDINIPDLWLKVGVEEGKPMTIQASTGEHGSYQSGVMVDFYSLPGKTFSIRVSMIRCIALRRDHLRCD